MNSLQIAKKKKEIKTIYYVYYNYYFLLFGYIVKTIEPIEIKMDGQRSFDSFVINN